MRKGRPWYFLTPSYWFGGGTSPRGKHAVTTSKGVRTLNPPLSRAALLDQGARRDQDVLEEERRMQDLLEHRTGGVVNGCGNKPETSLCVCAALAALVLAPACPDWRPAAVRAFAAWRVLAGHGSQACKAA